MSGTLHCSALLRSSSCCALRLALFLLLSCPVAGITAQAETEQHQALLDEYDTALPGPLPSGWYFNAMGGDRGVLNDADVAYSRDGDSRYRAEVVRKPFGAGWTWGGMWYSLVRHNDDDVGLDFKAVFGPYVATQWQGQVVEVQIDVHSVTSATNNSRLKLRVELSTADGKEAQPDVIFDNLVQRNYPATLRVPIETLMVGPVEQLVWVIDGAEIGDAISVEKVTMTVRAPALPPEEQAFLWSFAWLMTNYNAKTGMVKDKSRDGQLSALQGGGDSMESVSATAKTAKIAYYAYRKGYVSRSDAVGIINKIADTLTQKVPRGPSGANGLWPHFTENGGTRALPPRDGAAGSEWASGDTAFAALDIITALELIGDPDGRIPGLVDFVRGIRWSNLLVGDAISHGYDYAGALLPSTWGGFGMETAGVLWAYAGATGRVTTMRAPPSDNGSGFIDNSQYPVVLSGHDRWGNDWDAYRATQADRQISWYCQSLHRNDFLCDAGLFGLSAAENPEQNGIYQAYGVGGQHPSSDGSSDVVVLHYAGMIADIRFEAARSLWVRLLKRDAPFLEPRIVISPLNNMESMRVDKETGRITVNHLKGSWNLALQAEGWALASASLRGELANAVRRQRLLSCGLGHLISEHCLPLVIVLAADPVATEAALAPGAFVLLRAGDISTALRVKYRIAGSATPGADFVSLGSSAVFPPGASKIRLTVRPLQDQLREGSETVSLTLLQGANYAVATPASATVMITSDD